MADPTLQVDVQITKTNSRGVATKYPYTKTFSSQKEIYDTELTIPVSTEVLVWDPTNWTGFPIPAFAALVLVTDNDLELELVTDVGGEVGAEYISLDLIAEIPLVLGSDASRANYTTDVFAGTLDVIDQISVKNLSAVNVATLLVMLVDNS